MMIDIGIFARFCRMTNFELLMELVGIFIFSVILTIKVDMAFNDQDLPWFYVFLGRERLLKNLEVIISYNWFEKKFCVCGLFIGIQVIGGIEYGLYYSYRMKFETL